MRSRITTQSVLSLFISLMIIILIALSLIQVHYSATERTINSQAEDKILIISRVIQAAIDEVDEMTVDILATSEIQNFREDLPDSRNIQLELQNIANLFSSYQIFRPFVETFYINFGNDFTLSIGKVQEIFNEEYLTSFDPCLLNNRGRAIVSNFPGDSGHFVFSREIRRIKNLEQSHIANLHVVINLDKWLDIYFRKYGIQNIHFFLLQKDGVYYSYNKTLDNGLMEKLSLLGSGVYPIDKFYYYLHKAEISNTGWRVYILLPFNQIMRARNLLLFTSVAGLLIGLICLIFWGRHWSRRITRPIMMLADSMEKLQQSDFSDRNPELPVYDKKNDEIAVLYDNFNMLFQKIDFLINENYRKQLLLKETQLQNLIAQINPHFIYNTLDTISWMAHAKDTDNISPMVQALAKLLRASVAAHNIIPLEDEIDLLKGYLHIQKIRFSERLHFSIFQSLSGQKITVPGMILQPIVENSIKYCLDIPKSTVEIIVKIEKKDSFLVLSLRDDGPGISESCLEEILEHKRSESIGLGNIMNRLEIFYGGAASMEINSQIGEGTTVLLNIPISNEGFLDEPE